VYWAAKTPDIADWPRSGFLAYPAGAVVVRTIMTLKAFPIKAAFVLDNGGISPGAMVRLLIQVHSDYGNWFKRIGLACLEKCVRG
jgi:hypothetical protein